MRTQATNQRNAVQTQCTLGVSRIELIDVKGTSASDIPHESRLRKVVPICRSKTDRCLPVFIQKPAVGRKARGFLPGMDSEGH